MNLFQIYTFHRIRNYDSKLISEHMDCCQVKEDALHFGSQTLPRDWKFLKGYFKKLAISRQIRPLIMFRIVLYVILLKVRDPFPTRFKEWTYFDDPTLTSLQKTATYLQRIESNPNHGANKKNPYFKHLFNFGASSHHSPHF
jgi:hypothetical protein